MGKGLRRFSGFTAFVILVSVFSIVPASATVTATVGSISAPIIAGQGSSPTYLLTFSDSTGSGLFPAIVWRDSGDATNASAPVGIDISGPRIATGTSTLIVAASPTTTAGTYYFKAGFGSVFSSLVTLVVAPARTITIGSPSSLLTAGTAATPTYSVTTSDLSDGTRLVIGWFTNVSATVGALDPIGITASATTVSSNAATVTLTASNTSRAGTYYFKAFEDGASTKSNTVTLTVAAGPSSGADDSVAVAVAAAAAAAAIAAQAEIARKQVIEASKRSLLQNISENKTLTVSDLNSSDLQVSSPATAERINAQIKLLQVENPSQVITIEVVQGVVKKERLVDRLVDSDTKRSVMATDLIDVGLIDASNLHKSSTISALRKLPATSLDSFTKVESAVAAHLASIQVKKDRLAKVKARLLVISAGKR